MAMLATVMSHYRREHYCKTSYIDQFKKKLSLKEMRLNLEIIIIRRNTDIREKTLEKIK